MDASSAMANDTIYQIQQQLNNLKKSTQECGIEIEKTRQMQEHHSINFYKHHQISGENSHQIIIASFKNYIMIFMYVYQYYYLVHPLSELILLPLYTNIVFCVMPARCGGKISKFYNFSELPFQRIFDVQLQLILHSLENNWLYLMTLHWSFWEFTPLINNFEISMTFI